MSNETNNLNRDELAQSQPNPHATINDSDGALDAAISRRAVVLVSTTNPVVLTNEITSGRAVYLVLTADTPPPAGAFTLQFPEIDRGLVYIFNGTAQTVTIEVSGQVATPPTLLAGQVGLFIVSETDGVKSVVAGGGGGSTFIGLSDVPGSYSGSASKLVAVNAAATGLEFITTVGVPIRFPAGSIANPGIEIGESGTGWSLPTTNKPSFSIGGTEFMRITATGIAIGAGFDPASTSEFMEVRGTGLRRLNVKSDVTASFRNTTYSSTNNSVIQGIRSRGTFGSHAPPQSGDTLAAITGGGVNTTAPTAESVAPNGGTVSFVATETWAGSSNGTKLVSKLCPNGSNTLTDALSFELATGYSAYGSVFLDNNRIFRPRSYTKATLPVVVVGLIHCSDEDGGAQVLFGDVAAGNWRRVTDGKVSGTTPKQESIIIACSDETTALTAGTNKVKFRMPYALTLTAVRASLSTAQTSGSIFTVDINEAGTTILSTKLTIDNTELTSTTAATAPVISDTSLADDAEISIDIDQIGDGTAKGLKVVLIGRQPG